MASTPAPTSKYFVINPVGTESDFLDFGLSYGGGAISTVGESVVFNGSSAVDAVFVRPGLGFDLTSTLAGLDKIYLTGSLADYTRTVTGASATGAADSTPELQAMANAAAHVLADVATPTGQVASVTAADLAALGIAGIVTAADLAGVQAAIKTSTDQTALDTQHELQTLVNRTLGKTALNALAAAAEANGAASAALNAASYSAAGVTGVVDGAAGNIAAINSALDSGPINGARADTVVEVQAVVDAFTAILNGANSTAGSTPVTADQYFAIGVSGVSGSSLDGTALRLLDDVADWAAKADVSTTAKVQAMADAAARVVDLTGNPSASLSSSNSPSTQALANLGITGVDTSNLAAVQHWRGHGQRR
jgi:hypothetical protein